MLEGCYSAGLQQAVGLGSSIIRGGQEQEWLTVVQAAALSVKRCSDGSRASLLSWTASH